MNARIDEAVITELTNASIVNATDSLSIKYKRNGKRGFEYPIEINHLHLDDIENIEQIFPIYSEYQQRLNAYKHELDEINTAPLEELESLQGSGLMARKKYLTFHISRLKNLLDSLGNRMAYLQKTEAIQQLFKNE